MLELLLRRTPPRLTFRSLLRPNPPSFLQFSHYPPHGSSPRCHFSFQNRFLATGRGIRQRNTHSREDMLATFAACGIPAHTIDDVLRKFPEVGHYNPEKNLRPKLEFLLASGFSAPELSDLLAANPWILGCSLSKSINPSVSFLRQIIPAHLSGIIIDVLKHSRRMVTAQHLPSFQMLRKHGLSEFSILKMLTICPATLLMPIKKLEEVVRRVKKIGFDMHCVMFVRAVGFLVRMSEGTADRKLQLYRSFGWKEEEILTAFRKQPMCLTLGDEKIRRKLVFFKEVLEWDSSQLCKNPSLLLYSIEKRFMRRGAVLNLLMLKGLAKRNNGPWRFIAAEKEFMRRYVTKYEKKVPGLVEAYEGGRPFQGWEQGCAEKVWKQKTKFSR